MAKIRIDDLVQYRDIVGVVTYISPKDICTIAELKNRTKVHKLPIENLELVARKGTKRYSMSVEGALPVPVSRPTKRGKRPIDALHDAYANARVSKIDGSSKVDTGLNEKELMERIDLALDLKDEGMFQFYTDLYKKLKS